MKHGLGMLIGCGLSLIAIYALPVLGIGSGVTLAIFLIPMLVCHHFMRHSSPPDPTSPTITLDLRRFGCGDVTPILRKHVPPG